MATYMDAVEGKHTDGREQEFQDLFDRVINQLRADLAWRDYTAIEELLKSVPRENLIAYLSEENDNA
jgi:hypothetical protein